MRARLREAGTVRRARRDAYVLLGEVVAAVEEVGRDGVAAQGAQRGEVVGDRVVADHEGLLKERQVAGRGAGERGAVAGEVGQQEGAQPGALAGRLVDCLRQAEAVLDVLGRDGAGVEGESESTSEHTQLLRTERHAAAGSIGRGHARDDTR